MSICSFFLQACFGIFLSFVILIPKSSYSQACCSGGVPLSGTVGLSGAEKNTFQIMATYDYNILKSLYSENEGILNDRTRERRIHSALLEGSYNFTDRFSVTGMISWMWQERKIATIPGRSDFTSINGPGDGILLLKYHLLPFDNKKNMQISLGAGPKIPIGQTDFTNNNGIKLPADLQPGTGAWDAMLWGRFSKGNIWQGVTFSTLITSRITGTNEDFRATQDYQFGNEIQVVAGFKKQFLVNNFLMTPSIDFRYRHAGRDQVDNEDIPNTGGHWFNIVPSISATPYPNFSVRVGSEVPLYRILEGTQLTTSHKIRASIYYKFQ